MIADGTGVTGYEPINVPNTGRLWGGLENNRDHDRCLMDGSVDRDWWWYAVGSTYVYDGGIPGPSEGGNDQVTS